MENIKYPLPNIDTVTKLYKLFTEEGHTLETLQLSKSDIQELIQESSTSIMIMCSLPEHEISATPHTFKHVSAIVNVEPDARNIEVPYMMLLLSTYQTAAAICLLIHESFQTHCTLSEALIAFKTYFGEDAIKTVHQKLSASSFGMNSYYIQNALDLMHNQTAGNTVLH